MNDDPAASAIPRLLRRRGHPTTAHIAQTLGLSEDLVVWELRQLKKAGKVHRYKNGWQLTPVKRTPSRRPTKFQKDVMNVLIRMAGPARIETLPLKPLAPRPSELLDLKMPTEVVQ